MSLFHRQTSSRSVPRCSCFRRLPAPERWGSFVRAHRNQVHDADDSRRWVHVRRSTPGADNAARPSVARCATSDSPILRRRRPRARPRSSGHRVNSIRNARKQAPATSRSRSSAALGTDAAARRVSPGRTTDRPRPRGGLACVVALRGRMQRSRGRGHRHRASAASTPWLLPEVSPLRSSTCRSRRTRTVCHPRVRNALTTGRGSLPSTTLSLRPATPRYARGKTHGQAMRNVADRRLGVLRHGPRPDQVPVARGGGCHLTARAADTIRDTRLPLAGGWAAPREGPFLLRHRPVHRSSTPAAADRVLRHPSTAARQAKTRRGLRDTARRPNRIPRA